MKVLGLDVSTTCVGCCLMDSETMEILDLFSVDLKKQETLVEKAVVLQDRLSKLSGMVDVAAIEEPLVMFAAGGSSAQVISRLSQFNGIAQYVVSLCFQLEPKMINVNTARKLAFPDLKFMKGCSRKQVVFDKVCEVYSSIIWRRKRTGTVTDDSYDIADGIVIALALCRKLKH